MRPLVAVLKLILFGFMCLWVIPTQLIIMAFSKGPTSYVVPRFWHGLVCRVFNIRYVIVGTPNKDAQTLYMSNHLSYLDIPVLGGLLTGSFVAKAEVEHWPLFGFLSKLQRTAFIKRERGEVTKQKNSLQERLAQGQSLIIFPEGTSTDGKSVYPFKSSLFSIAMGEHQDNLYIQPLTISMLKVDGRDVVSQDDRDLYSWHIDMDTDLATHLWAFACSKGAILELNFHPPLAAKSYDDRKKLAKDSHEAVSSGLKNAQPLAEAA